jgi:hypothetical protein
MTYLFLLGKQVSMIEYALVLIEQGKIILPNNGWPAEGGYE